MRTDGDEGKPKRPTYDAEAVRQGRIVLDSPLRKAVFFGGLAAFVIGAIVLPFLM